MHWSGIALVLMLAAPSCGGKSSSDASESGGATASGGLASGGLVTGGLATGGAGSGESARGGASAEGGGGETSSLDRNCNTTRDCRLVNDCCNCLALNVNAAVPDCDPIPCFAASCDIYPGGPVGLDDLRCIDGQCAIALDCVEGEIACDMIEPQCGDGMVVSYSSDCYGPCVPIADCRAVRCVDVTCDSTRPTCPEDLVPEVDPATSCWTGRCADIRLCPPHPTQR